MNRAKPLATAHKNPPPSVVASVTQLTSVLATAVDYIKSNKDEVFRTLPQDISKSGQIAAFCVLSRVSAAVGRRLNQLRKLVDAQLAELPPLRPGEKERVISSGPFAVKMVNARFAARAVNQEKLRELLSKKHIPMKHVTYVPAAPPPFVSEELVVGLCSSGRITEAELDSVMEHAPVKPEVRVEVPDALDTVIEKTYLHGIASRAR